MRKKLLSKMTDKNVTSFRHQEEENHREEHPSFESQTHRCKELDWTQEATNISQRLIQIFPEQSQTIRKPTNAIQIILYIVAVTNLLK
jgi:hypothetical protein